MKNTNNIPDMQTISRYWGSLEAYKEEQRRTALLNLEENNIENKSQWNWDFRKSTPKTPGHNLRGLHFFGRS